MKKLLVVYYSRTGNTAQMAKAVGEGAESAGAIVKMKKVTEATPEDLFDCDAVIFGTPTNFGQLAGLIKEFFDQAWLTVGDKKASKPYAAFTSAGSGATNALEGVDGICDAFNRMKQFKFIKVCNGVVATKKPSAEVLSQCSKLGKRMAQL